MIKENFEKLLNSRKRTLKKPSVCRIRQVNSQNATFSKSSKKKGQIATMEMAFVLLLFVFAVFFFVYKIDFTDSNYKQRVSMLLDTVYYSEEYRSLVFNENLSDAIVTESWMNLTNLLNENFLNYEIVISNKTVSKTIVSCTSLSNKFFDERVFAFKNSTIYEFRKLKIGVCY